VLDVVRIESKRAWAIEQSMLNYKENDMEVLPLGNLKLRGKSFDVIAKVAGKNPRSEPPESAPAVVVLSPAEFEREMGLGYAADSQEGLSCIRKLTLDHHYEMPVADQIAGTDHLSWYGESPLLWALLNQEISCESVAFLATPSAIAYLQTRHAST
jgi:hypothetical protein